MNLVWVIMRSAIVKSTPPKLALKLSVTSGVKAPAAEASASAASVKAAAKTPASGAVHGACHLNCIFGIAHRQRVGFSLLQRGVT